MPLEPTVMERLRKIQALALSGIDGEKAAAKEMLDKMCKKYGVSPEELVTNEKKFYAFSYRNKVERQLLIQVIAYIVRLDQVTCMQYKHQKKVEVECTHAQYLDIEDCYRFYRKEYKIAWKLHTKGFLSAFIGRHNIYPPDNGERKERTEAEQEEIMRIIKMMQTIKPAAWERRIRIEDKKEE